MRTWTIKLAALVALVGVGLAVAQPPAKPVPMRVPAPAKPDPNSLEAMLSVALKTNPDIQVAEAKLREAEAGLNKARVQVLQQLVTAKNAVDSQKAAVAAAEAAMKRVQEMRNSGAIDLATVQKTEALLSQAKADLVKADADLGILLGRIPGHSDVRGIWLDAHTATGRDIVAPLAFSPDGKHLWTAGADGAIRAWDARTGRALGEPVTPAAGSMDARIREALTRTIKLDKPDAKKSCADAINDLKQRAAADVPIRVVIEPAIRETNVEMMAGELPLSSWLAVLEDSIPGLVFVVREYGILVTSKDRMPTDGLRVGEFLRRTEPKKDEAKRQ